MAIPGSKNERAIHRGTVEKATEAFHQTLQSTGNFEKATEAYNSTVASNPVSVEVTDRMAQAREEVFGE